MGSRPLHSTRPESKRLSRNPRRQPASHCPPVRSLDSVSALSEVRNRLEVVRAAAYVSSAALRLQQADSDADVAIVLQRLVGDVLDREIQKLDAVVNGSTQEGQS